MKYRKKPFVINAKQYTAEMQDDFEKMKHPKNENPYMVWLAGCGGCPLLFNWSTKKLLINGNLLDENVINVKDWIIKDEEGNFCVCPDDIFKSKFEPIDSMHDLTIKTWEEKCDSLKCKVIRLRNMVMELCKVMPLYHNTKPVIEKAKRLVADSLDE